MGERSVRWTRSLAALAATLVGLAQTGCSESGADPGVVAEAPSLSCLEILQCIVDCPDGDDACPDACGERGTPQGQTDILSFATCINDEGCTEATCVQDKCAVSLAACVGSSAPVSTGEPLTTTAPPGSVPAELVGSWAGARNGSTERLIFNADGSGEWHSTVSWQQYACLSFTRLVRKGSFVVEDRIMTLHATSVVQTVRECSPPEENTVQPATTEHLRWSRDQTDPNTLFVVDNACAAMYPQNQNECLGCPINLYCTYRVTRE